MSDPSELLDGVPDDPELQFIALEASYRARFNSMVNDTDESSAHAILEYINKTKAAATALGLSFLDGWRVPAWEDASVSPNGRNWTLPLSSLARATPSA